MSDEVESAGQKGIDHTEFYFSANVGEEVKPLARVASGGEASRLMLVLKTVANGSQFPRTIVFDEIDTGIGGRVSEAVGLKLKKLSQTNQVLCVTHQPQIARFADSHLVVQKEALKGRTQVSVGQTRSRWPHRRTCAHAHRRRDHRQRPPPRQGIVEELRRLLPQRRKGAKKNLNAFFAPLPLRLCAFAEKIKQS